VVERESLRFLVKRGKAYAIYMAVYYVVVPIDSGLGLGGDVVIVDYEWERVGTMVRALPVLWVT